MSCAASSSFTCSFFGFCTMSKTVGLIPASWRRVRSLARCKRSSARPPLVGSLGMPTTAPLLRLASDFTFWEKTPIGSMCTLAR